jgi:hypothetical protein
MAELETIDGDDGQVAALSQSVSGTMFRQVRGSAVATMISEVYDAFISAGVPKDKARKAAEAIASYENRLSRH